MDSLPEWDLGDLYSGADCPELAADLDRAAREAESFAATYKGNLAGLDGDRFGAAIAAYEAVNETLDRIASYAQLLGAADLSDPGIGRFRQNVQERVSDIFSRILFFALEINRVGDEVLAGMLEGAASRRRSWIANVRTLRPHELDEPVETLLHEKRVSGRAAWSRLFDETIADMRFRPADRDLALEETLDLLSDPEEGVRRAAADALGEGLARQGRVFSLIVNTIAKDKEIEDRRRRYERPQSARNLSNQVEDEVVDALAEAVREAFPDISHRYYRMKAGWLGKDVLDHWDRNAPLPEADDRRVPWEEARDTVLAAYGDFSNELAELGRRFFDNPWIDAAPRPGKSPGAFSHPAATSAHPYLLLNYQGRTRDVTILAHELGHGVHQLLAAPQGALMADTPLTLAETASVFGETLTFRRMLRAEEDPARRRIMLASRIEDRINTVMRQIAFHRFELLIHSRRREGELAAEEICDAWMEVQSESLGPAVRLGEGYRWFWAYVSHFVHSPFYVYAYAFGDCLANSLYAAYERAPDGFADRYLDMLRAGGTLRHRELLAPFGLDASDPGFWRQGLGAIGALIDELEEAGG